MIKTSLTTLRRLALALVFLLGTAAPAVATNFSFTGTFQEDDDVQLFPFTTTGSSNIVLRAYSYAGGTNAAGQVIPRGGFDTILALFDGSGNLINQNDDGGPINVGTDPLTGRAWDTYLSLPLLPAGSYTASITQYDNFAIGPNLSNGFAEQGNGNFTGPFTGHPGGSFYDVSGVPTFNQRTNFWAFDVLGATTATPEPGSVVLAGMAAGALCLHRVLRKLRERAG